MNRLLLAVLLATTAGTGATSVPDHVPQTHETTAERDARMQWFRDAKFGMFIHWGPCAIGNKEIGWGREANRPWDINRHGPRQDDPVYDNYYREFDPVKFDADEIVRLAREAGMRYIVLVSKHHDGFSMFDTKLSDHNVMNSPGARDIVKELADACHREGMRFGIYYSTRDWFHPDYLVGDNRKYDEWYRGQVRELLSNYGKVDIMWFDHVGGRDWGKWRFDDLFSMMYELQPEMLVNNRAAKFCGPSTPQDQGPPSPEIEKMTKGDYYTPEGRIGAMDIEEDWESCIHTGAGWSYRGEEEFKTPDECIRMLVSCTTGGGNLLLNIGPRADGSVAEGELEAIRGTGRWLERYGDAIYGTRGGPYANGPWGGSCHKGNKLFLHVFRWPDGSELVLDPLPRKVLSARTLDGAPVEVRQDAEAWGVGVAAADRKSPVTVIELTIDEPIKPGTLLGGARLSGGDLREFGRNLGGRAELSLSSTGEGDKPSDHARLFSGERPSTGYAFHTAAEKNPHAIIDLRRQAMVKAVVIENPPGDRRSEGLVLSVSLDGKNWEEIWRAPEWQEKWVVTPTRFHAGIDLPGRDLRYLKLETKGPEPRPLVLQRVTILGD
ncbi:MAG: alpha-L-fucosidase [Chthoniobacterales bacterium]|jgi:alpha-L-fucosidase